MGKLNDFEKNVVDELFTFLRAYYKEGKHHVCSFVVSYSKRIYKGLHLDSKGVDICGEPIALCNSILAGDNDIDFVVSAIWKEGCPSIVNPCGNCRQLLIDFNPLVNVIVIDNENNLLKVKVTELLKYPY